MSINIDAVAAAKKDRLIDKADGYVDDARKCLDREPDMLTNVDVRKSIEAAQALIETLSVWLAINNGQVV